MLLFAFNVTSLAAIYDFSDEGPPFLILHIYLYSSGFSLESPESFSNRGQSLPQNSMTYITPRMVVMASTSREAVSHLSPASSGNGWAVFS